MFAEIALNVLDIAQNSITAHADNIWLSVQIDPGRKQMVFYIRDDGKGMDAEQLAACEDPFFTTRTTRNVGLGIPFLKQEAEITGGSFSIHSKPGVGTDMKAVFCTDSIDCMPLGDLAESLHTLIVYNEKVHFVFDYNNDGNDFQLDTDDFHEILGDISFQEYEVSEYIREYLKEHIREMDLRASH